MRRPSTMAGSDQPPLLMALSILCPVAFVLLLPSLEALSWTDFPCAYPHNDSWAVSHMILSPQASGLFAAVNSLVIYYAWTSKIRFKYRSSMLFNLTLTLFTIGYVGLVGFPLEWISDVPHWTAATLGSTSLLLAMAQFCWYEQSCVGWVAVLAGVILFAMCCVTSVSHPVFYAMECVGRLHVGNLTAAVPMMTHASHCRESVSRAPRQRRESGRHERL